MLQLADRARVTTVADPFDLNGRTLRYVMAGSRVCDLVQDIKPVRGIEIVATLNGEIVAEPRECDAIVREGDALVVCARIAGGSSGSKDILRTVAMIGVMAAALWVPGALGMVAANGMLTLGGAALSAGIAIGGALLVNALLPAQQQAMGASGIDLSENTYGWSPSQNYFLEGLAIPVVYGTMKCTPAIISRYVSTDGETQFLNCLYAVCEGGVSAFTNLQLNDNDITNYPGVSYATAAGTNAQSQLAGFESAVSEKGVNKLMADNTFTALEETQGNSANELAFGVVFPGGLCRIEGNEIKEHSVLVDFEVRRKGDLVWGAGPSVTVTAATTAVLRKHLSWQVGSLVDEWEVRAAILSPRQTAFEYRETAVWEYMQEIVWDEFTYPNTALIGVKAMATDQLNGSNPRFTVYTTKGPVAVWDPGFAPAPAYVEKSSDNPAWACYDLLHNSRYGAGIPYSRLNYSEFAAWATWCDVLGYKVNIILESSTTLADALAKVGTAGRGGVVQRGTNFGCMYDGATLPVQLFTVGNIAADSFQESYLEKQNRADVIEMTILDEDNDYERRTFEIAAEGYDESTEEIRVAQVSLEGVTNWVQAAKYGKFLMNCQKYLMRTISFQTDVDAIACQPGDVISVQHDVPQWGFGGRIVSAGASAVKIDRKVPIVGTNTYVIIVRHSATDTIETKTLVNPTPDGDYDTFTLAAPWATIPSKDDVYSVGQQNIETKDFRVTSISRSSDMICTITAMEYRAEVYIDDVTIPEYPLESDLPQVAGVRADDIYPIGPDGEMRAPYIDVTWRGFAVLWHVFVKDDVDTSWRKVGVANRTHMRIDNVDIGKTYTVSVSVTDNPEDGVTDTILMAIDPPEVVAGLSAEAVDNFAVLRWGAPYSELPIKYYEVMKGDTFATAQSVGRADKTFTTVMERVPGTFTYWVYAVNTAGTGGTPASVTIALTMPTDYELTDQFTADFDTLSYFVRTPDAIVGPLDTTETWTEHFVNNSQTTMQGFADAGYTYYFEPQSHFTGYFAEDSTDMGATIPSAVVTLTLDYEVLTGSPSTVVLTPTIWTSPDNATWTEHAGVWTVKATEFRYVKWQVDVAATAVIAVKSATISLVLRSIEEYGQDVVTDANAGKVVTFAKAFVDVGSIVVTPLYDAAKRLHAVYDFTDIANPVSFTVYLYDEDAAAKTTGNFSYLVKGV